MSDTIKNTPTTARLIPLQEVSRITSLKKTSIYQLIANGEFHPVKVGRKDKSNLIYNTMILIDFHKIK